MTAEELIQSGLLEAYVLGQLDGEDARLVDRMRASDPTVRAELEAIEEALEKQAILQAVPPPSGVKEAIMKRIASDKSQASAGALTEDPAPRGVRTLQPEQRGKQIDPTPNDTKWRWLAAAAIIAFLLSAGVNVLTLRQLSEVRGELAQLQNDRSVLAEELQVQRASLERSNQMLAVMTDPRTDVVLLAGTDNSPDARARIYWDRQRNAVHMDVLQLPEPPAGQQYQLWALVDGQPVDAGVFLVQSDLQAMKDVPAAQAFAVTLEKEGGSPTPTLEKMVLMGQV